ncbi:lipoprotein-anchoring transpeptidase ErfK/SrfK [Nonomuraea muscovyensis]|uniref:Lipoprotein-anchoring transpeptidase ErfK/SrfK n=1 Tax=Nonomuraea muscovyensis TaxID=1124761 RepID=A0A7X0EXZ9_9ACTN|nr:Ig-like domain-containing protein [Nonomuraea muscovyensis]MBB6345320.1 lipoprotein-anchoring transpeptidase ErfK/SrfK [Nonomuraea muscovyensis]
MFGTAGCGSVTARAPAPAPPSVRVWPSFDGRNARTDRGMVVRARGGTLDAVLAYAGGQPVPGHLDATRTIWRSDWALKPGTEHTVTATATRPGAPSTVAMGRFRTRTPQRTFRVASAVPLPGETVGVGMPIILTFDAPVRDRAAVERALEVRAERPVEGAWRWVGDTQAVYRPREFWPARQRVTVVAHLAGVRAGPGVYGAADRSLTFTVGRAQTSTVDTRTHQMTVRRDGRVAQRMAISAGMATTREYTTTSGVHLTMDKGNPVRMVSPGRSKGDPGYYDLLIDHAVRISNSGEYVHAKDNVWAQGRVNVSHGCINSRPDQAAWFYAGSLRGDPVTITGTDRELEWDNGWGYWQLPWEEWVKGSALHAPDAAQRPAPATPAQPLPQR